MLCNASRLLAWHLQEVVRQMPKNAHYRSMLSKQWTDCTYLDVSPMQEKLSDRDRRHFNQTAMEHAREVMAVTPLAGNNSCTVCNSLA